jgi:large subunit ribosomal protein L10
MSEPRPEKVAVVDEVRGKLSEAEALLITEYRGLTVSDLARLRSSMSEAGGEYRIYKNTLVRRAAAELDLELDDMLSGPTALTFVTSRADGAPGDVATVAKAIRDFSEENPALVVKGGMLGDTLLDESGAKALASLPSAGELYSRLAGAVNGGARGLAGVVSGVHRSIAYVMQAAIDAGSFAGDAPAADEPTETPEAEAPAEAPEAEASADADPDESTEAESKES